MKKDIIALKKDFYNCEVDYTILSKERLTNILSLGSQIKGFKVLNSFGKTRLTVVLRKDLKAFYSTLNSYLLKGYVVELVR